MNIYDKKVAERELSAAEWAELDGVLYSCPQRYGYYRRHYPWESKGWAMNAAKSWGRNKQEQAARRKDHGTGAT